jgi:hypothetical protein
VGSKTPPVARGHLGQEGQAQIADAALERHALQFARVQKTVALGVVGFSVHDRREERGQRIGVHLSIRVHFDEDFCAQLGRVLVAGQCGAAHSLIGGVAE